MKKRTWLALPAVLALGLTACAGNADSAASAASDAASGAAVEATTGVVTTNGAEPQNPLIPGNTNETGGGKIIDLLFSKLVTYKADGTAVNDAAESITSDDNKVWTIKLRQDGKFSDGTPVLAKNFVEAWKKAAKESMLASYFYKEIEGASEEGTGDLTGLKVVDDYTFTITLKQPEAEYPARLGYYAYAPLPDSTLADLKAGGEKPVGNGPYKLGESGWEHNKQISLVPSETYNGVRKVMNGGVTIIFYASQDAAYADLTSGELDILDAIPDQAFSTYMEELDGRGVNQPAAIFQSFAIPTRMPHFSGEEGYLRREAISYSINRPEVTKAIFADTRTPAKDFTSPVVAGYNDAVPGSEVLSYNPEKAKELWAKADAIAKWDGKFEIAYNSDGGHQAWVDAVANSIKNTLGIEAAGKPYADFKSLRTEVTNRTITTAFRTGWQGDYPSKFNFIAPLYGTGAGSNDTEYSNPEVDKLIKEAAAAKTPEESQAILDKVQEILFKELPVIPLWYSNSSAGWSHKVDHVVFGWDSVAIYTDVTKAE
ncbi:ABC transporter substrate-binding protein [Schaalia sp. 19OD2882]|uniref:peptide ABC transporter substrate-binding protein n=1 Tax=Schaalia sp. 19OD2882 TaxID=2794089 RepID=UPI001C1E91D4|nr:ABC transporter substrate-binding protein [Schaalia sp. 19OD2882]QWW19477.1 ABC transporter substrate-binding protein [Schaalia sp. 19OD2882]